MKKTILFMLLISINLFAYVDDDMDGVEDGVDKCPNTPLMHLADINGCSIKSLVTEHRYDIIVGLNYSDSDIYGQTDTLSNSLQVDYYYKQFSIQASTSYFRTKGKGYNDSGLYDSFIGATYKLKPTNSLSIRLGAGILLPTYDTELNNNNTDYSTSVNLSYVFENINIFGGYSLTLINDDDTVVDGTAVTYQNTNAFSGGVGLYLNSKLYMSASYNISDSIYEGVEDMKTTSIYGYYTINEKWFSTFNYAHGLSDSASDNYLSFRFGFLF